MNSTRLIKPKISEKKNLKVKIIKGYSSKKEYYFKESFTIGRSDDCSVSIESGVVSRKHIEVIFEDGKWLLLDKNSSNGTYFNGNKIDRLELNDTATIELGKQGPILLFTFEDEYTTSSLTSVSLKDNSVTQYIKRYFDETQNDSEVGQHTRMMRQAFKVVKKKETTKYKRIVIAVVIVAAAFVVYSVLQQIRENKQKQLAENIFYDMKSLELEVSSLKENLSNSDDPAVIKALKNFDEKHKQLESNYNNLVDELGIYDLNEQDKVIIQTASIFGECELAMPTEFIDEVKIYINKWKSSKRFENALARANEMGYTQIIINYLIRNQLPTQFFYLALQESDFKEQVVGPPTRYGYAKGIWQFIAPTAERYGLKPGPLADKDSFDPDDDRYNLPKATSAAARYIKDIYNTDAQASGLLVMASYNWGEYNIINLIRKMPENPRDRNFWQLLEKYGDKIPEETYNYVFYIFSAAVIGENPKLFGFNFDNPLKQAILNIKN